MKVTRKCVKTTIRKIFNVVGKIALSIIAGGIMFAVARAMPFLAPGGIVVGGIVGVASIIIAFWD